MIKIARVASVVAIGSAAVVAMGQTGSSAAALGWPAPSDLSLSQTGPELRSPVLSLRYTSQHDTWNTVMLVSGIVFVVGLVSDNSALDIIGGVGVIVSLVETSSTRFHFGQNFREVDLLNQGSFSLGLSSIGRTDFGNYASPKPCLLYSSRF